MKEHKFRIDYDDDAFAIISEIEKMDLKSV